MKLELLLLDPIAEEYKKFLEPKFPELSIYASAKEEEMGDVIEKMDIIMAIRISDQLLKKATNLKWIQAKTTGVDQIVSLPSLRKDILITSTRGIHGPQVSEMAFLLMLALNRDLPQMIRNQDKRVWERWPAKLLFQKKVGILGVGVIGEEIARKCKAFGMVVYGIDIVQRKIEAVDQFYGPEALVQVIQEVDYFIISAPSTPQTYKMVGTKLLSSMKPTAFLINLGRGDIVDEEALINALKSGKIAGVALDVFPTTPLPKDHPLWEINNVIITPHVAGLCDIQVEQVCSIFEENLRRFIRGERRNLINLIER
ncbi:MAG: D-2-hydroxyacid dehydrogenase [Deltaproteobacteria bacterium]|nr:MAG: D-2-hydroxyacid dehydrogenase [Deltaproteobacteria bacterium]